MFDIICCQPILDKTNYKGLPPPAVACKNRQNMKQTEELELHEAPGLNRAIVLIFTHLVRSKKLIFVAKWSTYFNLKILETESDRNEETERRKTDVLLIAECLGQFI